MKPRHIVPNDSERILPTDRYILSTTDLAGRITSVNDLFVEYSGYCKRAVVLSSFCAFFGTGSR